MNPDFIFESCFCSLFSPKIRKYTMIWKIKKHAYDVGNSISVYVIIFSSVMFNNNIIIIVRVTFHSMTKSYCSSLVEVRCAKNA